MLGVVTLVVGCTGRQGDEVRDTCDNKHPTVLFMKIILVKTIRMLL